MSRRAPRKPKQQSGNAPARELTDNERAGIAAYKARRESAAPFPRLKVLKSEAGAATIASDHHDEVVAQALQLNALGLTRVDEFGVLVKQVVNLTGRNGAIDEGELNEMLALVTGIGPQNPLEAMLAVQMAAVHYALVRSALYLRRAEVIDQVAVHTKAMTTLGRTFAQQSETLKKLRSKGDQRVTVEHRHYHLAPGALSAGSQAVLGDVAAGGGGQPEIEDQSHGRDDGLRISERSAMLSAVETNRLPLQSTGSQREASMPLSRR